MKIAVGAGHNPPDYGRVNEKKHLAEYIEACKISAYLKDALWLDNYEIIDFCGRLKEKVYKINKSKADIAIEIHLNGHTNINARGAEFFYYPSDGSEKLAKAIEHSFRERLDNIPVRGSFIGHLRREPKNPICYILRKTRCPCIIVESLFITNPKEAEMLEGGTVQRILAGAIFRGVKDYVRNH